jgi:hypothetical protein
MTFEELEFKPHRNDPTGVQARVDFPNKYGASVIKTFFSYGSEDGLYELAVFHNGDLCYTSDITDDVIGGVSPAEVTDLLARIEALPEVITDE